MLHHPAVSHAEKAKHKDHKVNESFVVVTEQLSKAGTVRELVDAIRRCFRVAKHVKFNNEAGRDKEVTGTKPKTIYVVYGGSAQDKLVVANSLVRHGSVVTIASDEVGTHLKRRLSMGKNMIIEDRLLVNVSNAWLNIGGTRTRVKDVWVAGFSLVTLVEGAL